MRLLLDTHALLWALGSPARLSGTARDALEHAANEVWVSAVSFFEISTKMRSGRLVIPSSLLDSWEWTLSRLAARPLPLSPPAAIAAGRLSWSHKDPFDRLLAAQSLVDKLVLVTIDPFLHECPGLQVLW